jgi:3'-phosphoadenosine 5'-phosphosulfate sulfotransferase (PAPS reductase)/FAD synthetase
MSKVRHVLGISGGKDSAALAIYMKQHYPELDIEYYTSDTGKELQETYDLIDRLEVYLGKKIVRLQVIDENNTEEPFDYFLKRYGGYLPSSTSRWCTLNLKLKPFEDFVGNDPVISYVGIRGDEDREGYISKKTNIQSVFPFRKNIWSEDVVAKLLANNNIANTLNLFDLVAIDSKSKRIQEVLETPLSMAFTQSQKLNQLLNLDVKAFNRLVFAFLKSTSYPLATVDFFPPVEDDRVLVRDDIFKILEESGVGVPAYYKPVGFEIDGKKGAYSRSRSGCFFCFYQQKIEWIWLYEQHPEDFEKAVEYEKDGYTWNEEESLLEMVQPERIAQIKADYIKRTERAKSNIKSEYLLDILEDAESEGCASCFI